MWICGLKTVFYCWAHVEYIFLYKIVIFKRKNTNFMWKQPFNNFIKEIAEDIFYIKLKLTSAVQRLRIN